MIYRVSAHFKELFKMKILVIVDMQNDFINGALGTPEAQAAVGNVAKKISSFDGDLICITKDTHRSADYLKTQEGQLLPVELGVVGLFESQKRFKMFREHDFEIMYLNRRVSYFKDYADQKPSLNPPFSSVYVCKGMLPKQIIFEEIQKTS